MDEQKSVVTYECADRIAVITLNRPEKLNAFDDNMVRELMAALRHFDMDDDAWTAIICGNGRAFTSGADVKARQASSAADLKKRGGPSAQDAKSSDIFSRSVNWKPVLSAVHGYCLGLGITLAFDADMCVAGEDAKFQITETPRGLAGSGKLINLMAYRGLGSFAVDVSITGRFFDAAEAHKAGVVDRLAPKGKHLEVARELAATINKNPPLAVRACIQQRRWELEDRKQQALRYASLNKLYLSEDFQEATRAFVEKRPPKPFNAR